MSEDRINEEKVNEGRGGRISVTTENIFPIIRKWLYAEQDIFLRELVSNSLDAIEKYRQLTEMGEAEATDEELSVTVRFDADKKLLRIEDNGIGMTEAEIDKYINQIAFSGAVDFAEKYKKGGSDNGIIGHFGLGFYSAFMVADKVEIDSLSWQPGAAPAHWESEDGLNYLFKPAVHDSRGTVISVHLSEEAAGVFDAHKIRQTLRRYCAFAAAPIHFVDVKAEAEVAEEDDTEAAVPSREPINNSNPLWLKDPNEVTEEEYREFYREAFNDYVEPLFWIHLNMDYPFRLKGIFYFPNTDMRYERLAGNVKLFYKQIFVADDIKEVVPEYLFLLRGCIDCPDLPLNVSRSYLQNDAYVQKLSNYIVRKVADKLIELSKNEREQYEKWWPDVAFFVKYGSLKDEKFFDRVAPAILFPTTAEEFLTLEDLGEQAYYTDDAEKQVLYVRRAEAQGRKVLVFNDEIDTPFISMLEYKKSPLRFARVDSELEGGEGDKKLLDAVRPELEMAAAGTKLTFRAASLGPAALPAFLTETEEMRRAREMSKAFARMGGDLAGFGMDMEEYVLVVNTDNALINMLADEDLSALQREMLAGEVYDLARLGSGVLLADDLESFLERTNRLLSHVVWDQAAHEQAELNRLAAEAEALSAETEALSDEDYGAKADDADSSADETDAEVPSADE